jgi:hypothetical protein
MSESLRDLLLVILLLCALSISLSAQTAQKVGSPQTPGMSMPADRAEASYSIYSSLIPLGETAGKDCPHELWLIQDTTITIPSLGFCSTRIFTEKSDREHKN